VLVDVDRCTFPLKVRRKCHESGADDRNPHFVIARAYNNHVLKRGVSPPAPTMSKWNLPGAEIRRLCTSCSDLRSC
jgi:hypothetical protein